MNTLNALVNWAGRNWKSVALLLIWLATLAVGQETYNAWVASNAGLLATVSAIIGTLLPMVYRSAKTRAVWPPTVK